MVHSLTLLILMLLFAPYASMIPLSALAAILILVAWNMAERDHFRSLLKAPRSDVAVLLVTFGLDGADRSFHGGQAWGRCPVRPFSVS